ncbi:hypothetical protein FRC02_003564 [Tulasnella sp. 418]|nr:hypothetical protein FRC02_003564 [Tulasnella sp. 418]
MGIKGFIPFLRKQCPQLFHELPTRFSELGGKRIVIDGTLITQKLHFADDPHPLRHQLGWYKIINELKSFDVRPLCVFDGTERSKAKSKEVARRKRAKELDIARGKLESTRSNRLNTIHGQLSQLQHFDEPSFGAAWSRLREKLLNVKHHTAIPSPTTTDSEHQVIDTLVRLYLDFHSQTGSVASEADSTMSRGQSILLREEGRIWEVLAQSESQMPQEEFEDGDPLEKAIGVTVALEETSRRLLDSYNRRSILPTQRIYEDCRQLIRAMGVPVLQAEHAHEGEALAASLCIHGLADIVMSEDTDVLVYEVPLVRSVGSSNTPITLIDGPQIRQCLGLSRSAYVDLALLIGSDFSRRIPFIGPMTAINLMRSHGSIEVILESFNEPKKSRYGLKIPKEEYLKEIRLAREVFSNLPPVTKEIAQIVQQPPQQDKAMLGNILTLLQESQYSGHSLDEGFDFYKDYYSSGDDKALGSKYV